MSMHVITKPPRTLWDVFQKLPEGTSAQLIQNQLIMSLAPSDLHQSILVNLSADLLFFVRKHNLGVIRVAPYDVYFDKENVYQPDIVFISGAQVDKIQMNGFHGAPDLVIEILSPTTKQHDKGAKKEIYEQYGVKELWIIDPASNKAQGFFLKNKDYHETIELAGRISSRLLNEVFAFSLMA